MESKDDDKIRKEIKEETQEFKAYLKKLEEISIAHAHLPSLTLSQL